MEDKKAQQLIFTTRTLNREYRDLLQICAKDFNDKNWDKAYAANQKWVDAVNQLKKHDDGLLIEIMDQFRF